MPIGYFLFCIVKVECVPFRLKSDTNFQYKKPDFKLELFTWIRISYTFPILTEESILKFDCSFGLTHIWATDINKIAKTLRSGRRS